MKVGIIGLGLIGWSLGLALKKSGFADRVLGYDKDERHTQIALDHHLIDEGFSEMPALIENSDLIILAIPVQIIKKIISTVLDGMRKDQILIDVGSTKEEIVEQVKGHVNRSRYLATHPMAGTEYSGPEAALVDLFEGKACVFCDQSDTDEDVVEQVEKLYRSIGMNIVYYDSKNHDIHTAYVSHISHISSFALALTVLEKEKNENRIFELASGGFSSTVRLAKSNPETWIPIFEQNRDNVLDVLDEHINVISRFRTLLIKKDFDAFYALMERANDISRILK